MIIADFSYFLFPAMGVGFGYNRLDNSVLGSSHNLCFLSRNKDIYIFRCKLHFSLYEVRFSEVFFTRTCYRDEDG